MKNIFRTIVAMVLPLFFVFMFSLTTIYAEENTTSFLNEFYKIEPKVITGVDGVSKDSTLPIFSNIKDAEFAKKLNDDVDKFYKEMLKDTNPNEWKFEYNLHLSDKYISICVYARINSYREEVISFVVNKDSYILRDAKEFLGSYDEKIILPPNYDEGSIPHEYKHIMPAQIYFDSSGSLRVFVNNDSPMYGNRIASVKVNQNNIDVLKLSKSEYYIKKYGGGYSVIMVPLESTAKYFGYMVLPHLSANKYNVSRKLEGKSPLNAGEVYINGNMYFSDRMNEIIPLEVSAEMKDGVIYVPKSYFSMLGFYTGIPDGDGAIYITYVYAPTDEIVL